MRKHQFYYKPALLPTEQRYWISLPADVAPRRWGTLTAPMGLWVGQVVKASHGRATALTWHNGEMVEVDGKAAGILKEDGPCYIMEHLKVDGHMEYLITPENIQQGNQNFVNFGIPKGKHLRIDIYTGESRIIDG